MWWKKHPANSLLCIFQKTHGKEPLLTRIVPCGVCRAFPHGKAFAVFRKAFAVWFCTTANSKFPVVIVVGAGHGGGFNDCSADEDCHPTAGERRPRQPMAHLTSTAVKIHIIFEICLFWAYIDLLPSSILMKRNPYIFQSLHAIKVKGTTKT